MANQTCDLFVLAHLNGEWAPAGRLTMLESGLETQGARFAYGLKYIRRTGMLPIVPTASGWLPDREALEGIEFYPEQGLPLFGV